ncbi:SDR family oxidoreductase [Embleya scabrispora]|uniref:SDR family oxidoreductase n=1 Tax=Embleya scabrispora TaxID=159449 RepID=UPI0003693563|nr:SDR family oxidoreductase [Embleya scabrispora]MYS84910.1 SDR family oxidoreductase [Streptomyces sp. SID5474]
MKLSANHAVLVGLPTDVDRATAQVLRAHGTRVTSSRSHADAPLRPAPDLFVIGSTEARPAAAFLDTDPQTWWADVEGRLSALFARVRAAGRDLVAGGGGRIVLVLDARGLAGAAGATADATVGAAAIALTKSLARELGPAHVAVNAAAVSGPPEAGFAEPTPHEIAETIAFLADPRLPSLTGQTLPCTGGTIRTRA